VHAGLVNWDSRLTDWNSVQKGPHVDIVGELAKEARRRDMKVLTSFHSTSVWGPISKDDPRYLKPTEDNSTLLTSRDGRRSDVALDGWLARTTECIDLYRPDMIWFDTHFGGTVPGELKGRFREGRLVVGADNWSLAQTHSQRAT
jgi:alpha-L-fucosidase